MKISYSYEYPDAKQVPYYRQRSVAIAQTILTTLLLMAHGALITGLVLAHQWLLGLLLYGLLLWPQVRWLFETWKVAVRDVRWHLRSAGR